ncbi:3-keto-disaccharide hydrolase [Labilibacter marinus]|uniref:3-keto-disaccharide hydrolase n=1 Tax=Labilibacter marinus TaxID=1477105 RepID=UPI00094FF05F|nr:DUF1080 domain-containing protein [Labilibacter marinus]
MKNIIKTTAIILCFIAQSIQAQDNKIDPKKTEDWGRKPAEVIPGKNNAAPSDALVLFNGKNLDNWVKAGTTEPAGWKVKGKTVTVVPKAGAIETKQHFGDCQLHIEWRSPKQDVKAGKKGQGNGNSGIFLMGRYEVQVLNSYNNETYYNGMASSIYKQHIPLVNPAVAAGKWQSYDIIFTAPRFNADKSLKSPAYATVIFNGVIVQNHVEIQGPTVYRGKPSYSFHEAKAPIKLQDHSNEVSYRNIWIREL